MPDTEKISGALSCLSGKQILVGISGGVAAYKTAILVSRLVQNRAEVRVVMTESATRFVGTATLEALTGHPVCMQQFGVSEFPLGPHITLAEQSDLMCVAPATANQLAKASHGIANDLLSTLYLTFQGPMVFAPAMNCEMWDKPAVQRNVKQLEEDGIIFVGPEEGWLSCRRRGKGRMSEPEAILETIVSCLSPR